MYCEHWLLFECYWFAGDDRTKAPWKDHHRGTRKPLKLSFFSDFTNSLSELHLQLKNQIISKQWVTWQIELTLQTVTRKNVYHTSISYFHSIQHMKHALMIISCIHRYKVGWVQPRVERTTTNMYQMFGNSRDCLK